MPEVTLHPNITLSNGYTRKIHLKACEEYLAVEFTYEDKVWKGWVPVECRRTITGLNNASQVNKHLNNVYVQIEKAFDGTWLLEERNYWENERRRATVTRRFFDVLAQGGWQCATCDLPDNRNFARRTQALKDYGYTLATDTNRFCSTCETSNTHLILLPIQKVRLSATGYETWSPALRKRILKILKNIDVYENKKNGSHVLLDHKFPEIRWDSQTKADNPDTMTDAEIKAKYQLLTNQRNQQKREVCRECYQTGKRGIIFGITYYYKGNQNWDKSYPTTGKAAEKGCEGCGWYDIAKWREGVNKNIIISKS